jgi:hypothetical protein
MVTMSSSGDGTPDLRRRRDCTPLAAGQARA